MVPEGQGGGHKKGNYFYICKLKESFKKKHLANINQTWNKHFLHDGNSNLFK
jgi:hypothetical protein